MGFELTQDHEDFRAVVREFAEAEIRPYAEQWDRDHVFPVDTVLQMGELGFMGLAFPEDIGGGGGDFTSLCVAIEELGRVDQSMGITLELAGFGLTEPDAGSDAGATKTKAVLDGDEWVINGTKTFITNSGSALTSLVTVTTVTGDSEISTIIVPSGTPGFHVEPQYRKMGWHASDTHGLSFTDCRVPAENLLGERGRGFRQFLATLDDGRIAISALAVGLIQGCLEECVSYAKERKTFGKPIGVNQGVSFQIADLEVMVESARMLTYKAAWLKDQGRPIKQAAAIAKLYSSEAAVSAARIATQIFGGYGFMDETLVSRFYRDAKILEIGEGTSEIQRLVIARGLGLPVA